MPALTLFNISQRQSEPVSGILFFQVDLIWNYSDSLLGSQTGLREIAESRSQNTLSIRCYGRVNEINPKIIELISKIGIEHIYIGVEVGSNEGLKEIKKGTP